MNDCSHISLLLSKYGPDYNRLKSKLGYVRGLFEEGTDWRTESNMVKLTQEVLQEWLEVLSLFKQ